MGSTKTFSLLALSLAGLLGVAGCATEVEEEETTASAESPLKTKVHKQITGFYCLEAGFSRSFCDRLESEAFDVDRREWDNNEAHAVQALGQSKCAAAANVQGRLRRRGAELRAILAKPSISRADMNQIASSLGRALHTIQDNCAHEGMTNAQHSWYSNRGWCLSNGEDPDERQSAIQCAWDETWDIMKAFASAVSAARFTVSSFGADDIDADDPSRRQVCSFLREWQSFDGLDERWDNGITTPAFRATFKASFTTGESTPDVCEGLTTPPGAASPITTRTPRRPVSVSDPLCFTSKAYCFGL